MDEGYGRGVGWGEQFKGAWLLSFWRCVDQDLDSLPRPLTNREKRALDVW